jgi:hypothetical protein
LCAVFVGPVLLLLSCVPVVFYVRVKQAISDFKYVCLIQINLTKISTYHSYRNLPEFRRDALSPSSGSKGSQATLLASCLLTFLSEHKNGGSDLLETSPNFYRTIVRHIPEDIRFMVIVARTAKPTELKCYLIFLNTSK